MQTKNVWRCSGPFSLFSSITISSLQGSHSPLTCNAGTAELCRHTTGQNIAVLSSLFQTLSSQPQEETTEILCIFQGADEQEETKTLTQCVTSSYSLSPGKKYVSTRTSFRGEELRTPYSFSASLSFPSTC